MKIITLKFRLKYKKIAFENLDLEVNKVHG